MEIESIFIDGKEVDTSENKMIEYFHTDFGPGITFKSDTPGTFKFKVNARFGVWDDKVVPIKWPITVSQGK